MLNEPAHLLPWIHANTVAYVRLCGSSCTRCSCSAGRLPIIALTRGDPWRRCWSRGAFVGMVAAMVNAATAPPSASL